MWGLPNRFRYVAPAVGELDVAVAISQFGLNSGAVLATVAGVPGEEPVMSLRVAFANCTRRWLPANATAPTRLHPRSCPAGLTAPARLDPASWETMSFTEMFHRGQFFQRLEASRLSSGGTD